MGGEALDAALARGAVEVLYRPVASSTLDGVAGLRSQVRWRTDAGTVLQEEEVQAVAEASGLDVALDRHVLADATGRLAEWGALADGTVVWAGLSGATGIEALMDDAVRATHDNTAERHRLGVRWPADAVVASDPDALLGIRREGVAVMVGDVVPGHGVLHALEERWVDVLQLDAHLVRSLPTDPDAVGAATEIIRLCARHGVPAVAAGVDHTDVLELLEGLGIDQVEGVVAGRAESPLIVGMLLHQVLTGLR
ncbi:MAG: EAL domain-containing protein [Actinomycetota bacterium]